MAKKIDFYISDDNDIPEEMRITIKSVEYILEMSYGALRQKVVDILSEDKSTKYDRRIAVMVLNIMRAKKLGI